MGFSGNPGGTILPSSTFPCEFWYIFPAITSDILKTCQNSKHVLMQFEMAQEICAYWYSLKNRTKQSQQHQANLNRDASFVTDFAQLPSFAS